MDLLLQKDLPHQQYAVDAVSKVFENVAVGVPSFYYMNPLVNIKDSNIESNITELQKSVENAECSYLPAKDYLHIDIKMETGTGKTFVYTKTIFELHQRYGFNKFVIAVPSLPIKEGTKSFILLEQIIERNIGILFSNYKVLCAYPYRIMRNADLTIDVQ